MTSSASWRLLARTAAIARHLTDFLKQTDRFAKTLVFCVNQEHALEMRLALARLNADLLARFNLHTVVRLGICRKLVFHVLSFVFQ